jgi:adenosylhomocysteinase
MALFREGFASKKAEEREIYVKVLPKKLDEEVAALMVKGFGGTITKLTKYQQEYISVKQDGPFKSKSYNY